MYDLTQRQIEILKCIVEEYINSADPVGSETLEKKYDLGVSPATIRNEMAEMVRLGYLKKPHSSSGRIPSSKALKFYVSELMHTKNLSTAEEVRAKEKVWDHRARSDHFLKEAVRDLATQTNTLALALTDEGDAYYAGYPKILEMPEFYDIDITRNFLSLLDDTSYFTTILSKMEDNFSILIGSELENDLMQPYGFVFSRFRTKGNRQGIIGIAGPARLPYPKIVPCVKYYGTLVEEVADW